MAKWIECQKGKGNIIFKDYEYETESFYFVHESEFKDFCGDMCKQGDRMDFQVGRDGMAMSYFKNETIQVDGRDVHPCYKIALLSKKKDQIYQVP